MTTKPKRILLVDNDKNVLNAVRFRLEIEGYEVLTAESPKAALGHIHDSIFHLAIIDIRLKEEKNKADIAGFQVAAELPTRIPFVIYTAYEDLDNLRQALGTMHAADLISKIGRNAPTRLINTINHLAATQVNVNTNLRIESSLSLDQLAEQVEISPGATRVPTGDDVVHILQSLFFDADAVHISALLTSEPHPADVQLRPGSVLLQACPQYDRGTGVPVVVKICDRTAIAKEAQNYQAIKPFLGGQRRAVLERRAECRQIAGLVYSLIGADDWESILTFSEFFQQKETRPVINLLENFFSRTFGRLYGNAYEEILDLTAIYTEGLRLTPQKLQQRAAEIHPAVLNNGQITFPALPEPFKNPITWAIPDGSFRRFKIPARKCLCHGDLHGRNILVDRESHVWLVDFGRACESHALRDIVELETDIKFNLLPEIPLPDLLRFENALLGPARPSDSRPHLQFAHPKLDHAYQVITALRGLTGSLINLNDMQEYFQALFLHTLNIIRLRHIKRSSKEYALLSASLLCQRLENWPMW